MLHFCTCRFYKHKKMNLINMGIWLANREVSGVWIRSSSSEKLEIKVCVWWNWYLLFYFVLCVHYQLGKRNRIDKRSGQTGSCHNSHEIAITCIPLFTWPLFYEEKSDQGPFQYIPSSHIVMSDDNALQAFHAYSVTGNGKKLSFNHGMYFAIRRYITTTLCT